MKPVLTSVLTAALLVSSACDETVEPKPALTWADSAFGAGVVQWVVSDPGGAATMKPVLDGDRVYMASAGYCRTLTDCHPSILQAFSVATGETLWYEDVNVSPNIAVAGDVVALGGLTAFDRRTGAFKYQKNLNGSSNLVTDGSRFYFATGNGHVGAADAATGLLAWDTDASGTGALGRGVTIDGSHIVATFTYVRNNSTGLADTGVVASVNRTTGALQWRTSLPLDGIGYAGLSKPAIVIGGNVIVTTERHHVFALDLVSGATLWHVDASYGHGGEYSSGLSACNSFAVTPAGDLSIQAMSATTGATQWKASNLRVGSVHEMQCAFGTALVQGSGIASIVDAVTGRLIAEYPRYAPLSLNQAPYVGGVTRDQTSLYLATNRGYARIRAP